MGSLIETNDTLQITKEQGFPSELNLGEHLKNPITLESLAGKVFEFRDKPAVRVYQQPPVRNFLVENRDGKWIYWGLIHILEVRHDYERKTTSGTFRVIYINTPEEMRSAHALIDQNSETNFFEED